MGLLIAVNADVHAEDNGGTSAARLAAQIGNARCIQLLVDANARIDEEYRTLDTSLMWAIRRKLTKETRRIQGNSCNPSLI